MQTRHDPSWPCSGQDLGLSPCSPWSTPHECKPGSQLGLRTLDSLYKDSNERIVLAGGTAGLVQSARGHHITVSPSVTWKLDTEPGRTLRPSSTQQRSESDITLQRQETTAVSKRSRRSWQEKALSRGYCLTSRISQVFRTPGNRVIFQLVGLLLK